jgi:putative phage-type endonuclease
MALTELQLANRKIGGSDVATILGLNPYKTAVELYHEMRGTLTRENLDDNLSVVAGNVLEDAIADLAAIHMGRMWRRPVKLRRSNQTIVNPRYDWLTVHIDRDVVGEERGVELKNVGANAARSWGPALTDDIPNYYLPQPHTYMLVKGYPVWTVAGYFGGADMRLYELERSADMDQVIIERTHDFYHYHVLAGTPPPIDFSARDALRVVRRLYPGTTGEVVVASADDEHWFHVLREAKAMERLYKLTAERALAHLEGRMEGAAIMQFDGDGKLTRKLTKRKGYAVDPTEYMQTKITKPKGGGDDDE